MTEEAASSSFDCLITTYKDAVKIESFDFGKFYIYSAMLDISIVDKSGDDADGQFKRELGFE